LNDRFSILIAEDEAVNSFYLEKILILKGYRVAGITTTGKDAVTMAGTMRPDLILMDIKLQGDMDGITAVEKINESSDIPVIYLTAHENEEILQRAKITEPFGYIIKPINKFELYSAIEIARYRHEMRKKLKLSEEKYRSLIENINDVVFAVNAEGYFTFISGKIEQLAGYTSAEITGSHYTELVYPGDHDAIRILFGNFNPDRTVSRDIRIQSRQGEDIWVHASGNPIVIENRLTEIRGVMTDITERKNMEEDLKLSNRQMEMRLTRKAMELLNINEELFKEEALLDGIIKLNPYGISIYDSEGRFIMGNRSFILLFGAVPYPHYSLYRDPVIVREGMDKGLRDLRSGEADKMLLETWYYPDEIAPGLPVKKVFIRGIYFPIMTRDSRLEYIVAIHEDITQQKNAEQAIKKARDDLETRVQDRTRDLEEANTRLRKEIEERHQAEIALSESEERYMSLFENSLDGVFMVDFNGNFIEANRAAKKMLGYEAEKVSTISIGALLEGDQMMLASTIMEDIKKQVKT